MSKVLDTYEDLNLSHYSDMDLSKLIFNNPANKELRDSMIHTSESLRNPFTDLYHWVKGEWFDLVAIKNACETRAEVAKSITKLQARKESTQKNLDNVNQGKKTMGTLFKSSSDAGTMANQLESVERDIEASNQLYDVMTIYLGDKVITKFKKEKLQLFQRII